MQVLAVSAATHEGLRDLAFAMARRDRRRRARARQRRSRPARSSGLCRSASPASRWCGPAQNSFFVRGAKPRRWILQTDFGNDEAVGYLADRLARLGVEEALAEAGAQAGAEVMIGDDDDAVVFDWEPGWGAGAAARRARGSWPGLGPRGSDRRLRP